VNQEYRFGASNDIVLFSVAEDCLGDRDAPSASFGAFVNIRHAIWIIADSRPDAESEVSLRPYLAQRVWTLLSQNYDALSAAGRRKFTRKSSPYAAVVNAGAASG